MTITEALQLLGVVAHQTGRHEIAVEWIRQAIALDPNNSDAHSNLGNALATQGRLEEAIDSYRRALHINPGFPDAHNNLGSALMAIAEIPPYDRGKNA